MKGLTITVLVLGLTAAAAAKPVPVSDTNPLDDLNPAFARNDVDINSGAAVADTDIVAGKRRVEIVHGVDAADRHGFGSRCRRQN